MTREARVFIPLFSALVAAAAVSNGFWSGLLVFVVTWFAAAGIVFAVQTGGIGPSIPGSSKNLTEIEKDALATAYSQRYQIEDPAEIRERIDVVEEMLQGGHIATGDFESNQYTPDEPKLIRTAQLIVRSLRLQANNYGSADHLVMKNDFSIGYIAGYSRGSFECAFDPRYVGQDARTNGVSDWSRVTTAVFYGIFGKDDGDRCLARWKELHKQSDPIVCQAYQLGAGDAMGILDGIAPKGWARHLHGGKS